MIPPGVLESIIGRDRAHLWLGPLTEAANAHGIDTPLRLQHFLAQLLHESAGFTRLHENLNYSPERLRAVWPHRFPTLEAARRVAGNPVATAELVYGGRLGNGPPGTGDGYRYRGRGLIHLTGRHNYRMAQGATGIPVVRDPELAATPARAATIAAWYWRSRNLNARADKDDLEAVTRGVNGGLNGLQDRRRYLTAVREAWTAALAIEPTRLGTFDVLVLHDLTASDADAIKVAVDTGQPAVLPRVVASRTPRGPGWKLDIRRELVEA